MTAPSMPPASAAALPVPELIPLTPLQQGMYFTWLQDPAAGIDIEQMVCTLPEAIDAPRLRAAWETLTATHDILRTTFTAEAATLHPTLPTPWQELDLSPSTFNVQRSAFNVSPSSSFPDSLPAFLEKDRTTPFDLPTGPLQRLTLIRVAPEDYRLIWTFHHILIDGRAITALLQQVFALYDQAPSVPAPAATTGPLSNLKSQIPNPPSPSFQAHNRWQATLDHTPSAPFWKAHLTGINGPSPLVVDHLERAELGPIRPIGPISPISPAPNPTASHPAQAEADFHLSPSLTTTLRTLATTHGLTLNTFVQAAFALLLGRYASEDRVIFGATRACRHTPVPGSPSTIGLLINTLPLAVALPSDQPLLALLQNLRQHWLDLRPHEHTPLSFIRRTAGLSATAAPFNHLLVFENDDYTNTLRATGGPAFAHRRFHLRELTSVPLTLAVYGSASLHLHCAYAPAIFDADTIQRLLGHVANLLEQFATLPLTTPLSACTLTTPAERQLLLHDCQPIDPGLDSSHTLHGLFRKTAAKFPERIAVTAEDTTWTYAQLDQHSDVIAHALIQGGVQPGQFVGICMDRRAPLIAALLGILKAGAAYLPIDLAYPPERLAFMLEDAQAPILLTERPLASKIPQNPATTLFIEDINFDSPQTTESLSQPSPLNSQPLPGSPSQISNFKSQIPIPVPHDPDSLAYIIYTSGSTGLPKGCQITHRNVVRLMLGTNHWYRFNESDVWTLFHSTAFDFSVWELWGALLYGGRLVVVPWLTTRSPDDFFKLLCEERVTVLNQTPSAFRQLIQAEPLARATTPNLPPQSLRYVIFGGEALEMQSLKPWYDRHGDTAPVLVNMYGITETTVHVTYRPLSATDLDSGSVIGVPIPDLQLYILDPQNQQPVPLGIPGEMYVGGAGLATGYLRRPELTADRFIPNHLTGYGRLYKTGDLARFLPRSTGVPPVSFNANALSHKSAFETPGPESRAPLQTLEIEYLGRIDHQVKIRGFRIELGEIENILTSHPGIHEAAVLAREDRPGDKRLCAYLVPDHSTFNVQRSTFDVPPSSSPLSTAPSADAPSLNSQPSTLNSSPPPTPGALRALLKTRVPDYMVPAAFVFLGKFPITPNGKLDRKALPAPIPEGPATTRPFIPPATPAEESLTTIWTQVLRLDRISTTDNFFEIGGDSILSIQVIARAREAGLALTPRQLFENPTITALAAVATPLKSQISNLKSPAEDLTTPFPLTPIQRWFFDQNLEDSHHWNQTFLFTLSHHLDPENLHRALHALTDRHPSLRLRFRQENHTWIPSIAPQETHVILNTYHDLDHLESRCAELQTTLNYQTGPLLRAALFQSPDPTPEAPHPTPEPSNPTPEPSNPTPEPSNPTHEASDFTRAPKPLKSQISNLKSSSPSHLCLAVHHLAIDGVSWRILLEDLESLLTGKPLPAPTASWPQWARQLQSWPTTPEAKNRLPHWCALTPSPAAPVTREADTFTHIVTLTESETTALLHQAPAAYRTRINDLLLTALAMAERVVRTASGAALATPDQPSHLSLNLEGHGREESISGGLSLDRTIGWFTALFTVHLNLPSLDPAEAIPSIKEQLRAIPDNGASHQLLAPSLPPNNQQPITNNLVFNYLGQFDALTSGSTLFAFAPESTGPWHSPRATRAHATEINAMVIRGQLETTFASATPAHTPESLTEFAEAFLAALRSVIAHCLATTTPRFTPSDFPLAHLDQTSLDALLSGAQASRLSASTLPQPSTLNSPLLPEDICRLSPMQRLFHNAALTKPNAGFDQWRCRIRGPLDLPALQAAWTQVIQRHTILRSTFHHTGLPHPVMLVHATASPDFTVIEATGEEAITRFLTSDASQVNDLTKAPCGRFTLLRLAPEDHFFCWSVPDLQLDGWSWPIVFSEAAAAYRALTANTTPALPHPRPYRDYLAWLERQTEEASDDFWRATLTGLESPTPVPLENLPGPRASRRTAEARLSLTTSEATALTAAARRLGLTPGVLAQAAWATLLAHSSGTRDVVHGSAFSGRPADLPGADRIAGPFVNNLPVRSHLDPALPATDFLRRLHAHLTDLTAHQFTPLPRIQDCSAVPWRFRLFDSILVFQNYQVDDSLSHLGPETTLSEFDGPIHTSFPLTMVVTPGETWDLLLVHQEAACSASRAQDILADFSTLLRSLAASPETALLDHFASLRLTAGSSPSPSRPEAPGGTRTAARTAMEKRLAAIWQRAFGLAEVGTTDNFFDLGGHSLLMLRVHAAISQDLQRPLPITALFQYPTIATLAAHLDPAPAPNPTAALSPSAAVPNALQNRAAAARAAAQRAAAARR